MVLFIFIQLKWYDTICKYCKSSITPLVYLFIASCKIIIFFFISNFLMYLIEICHLVSCKFGFEIR
jgi:hypothetical protein